MELRIPQDSLCTLPLFQDHCHIAAWSPLHLNVPQCPLSVSPLRGLLWAPTLFSQHHHDHHFLRTSLLSLAHLCDNNQFPFGVVLKAPCPLHCGEFVTGMGLAKLRESQISRTIASSPPTPIYDGVSRRHYYAKPQI